MQPWGRRAHDLETVALGLLKPRQVPDCVQGIEKGGDIQHRDAVKVTCESCWGRKTCSSSLGLGAMEFH